MSGKYCFAIDRGGTFTDVICICPDRRVRTLKLLSEDPKHYPDAPREGIRRILQEETGAATNEDGLITTDRIGWIRMGTTVATNALLERRGDPVALVVNRGFRDLLQIGNQARPSIFELNIQKPSNLYATVVEVDCRLVPAQEGICQLQTEWPVMVGTTGAKYLECAAVDAEAIRRDLAGVLAAGITSLAVVLAHSYACPQHEAAIGVIAHEMGFAQVTLSHEAMPMCRMVPRGFTAAAEAYLTPHVARYVASFAAGFENRLRTTDVLFMQSDGGLTRMDRFRGARAILSGPAGGVVGYAVTGSKDTDEPLIGFDMGGTSTDVSRYGGDHYEHVVESTTAGVTIQAPQLDINTVAAGGGSMLFYRAGLFVVGPESAGAHPGPACYRKGGPLTVTDANLVLGRLLPDYFPHIFGATEKEPLDVVATRRQFEALRDQINAASGNAPLSVEAVAIGFIRVANEAMCRPIRALTQARGLDTARHVLACFGGAGGQHACSVARALGMQRILVHKYAGILSAYGMALADVVHETQRPLGIAFDRQEFATLQAHLDALVAESRATLAAQGFDAASVRIEPFLHLRYKGTDCALMCAPTASGEDAIPGYGDFRATFLRRYLLEFGFVLVDREIIVDDVRVRASGLASTPDEPHVAAAECAQPPSERSVPVFYDSSELKARATAVYLMSNLQAGHRIDGPAIIIDALSTILVEPDSCATVTVRGDLIVDIGKATLPHLAADAPVDPIQLSIFGHRFMSIAEQMGRVLQRTAISTNIKERLDFSCALFGPDGGLVSNAPHIPVHLGAMQETVQYQLRRRGDSFRPGDAFLSNHPQAGGSHLPDLTVVTPVFDAAAGNAPVFFVASRGHHADIGGITPGSMPPHSTSIDQEGVAFKSFRIVAGGEFREQELVERLTRVGNVAGAVGTRNLGDNLSDLRAQLAANQRGIQLVGELIAAYTLPVVQAYMAHIQRNAELAVRELLRGYGTVTLAAEERMDDGSPIRLRVTIDGDAGTAICDFAGSGAEVWGNCNAPRAVVYSALIYSLRCMVGHDMPLNQGCLAPVTVHIPTPSMLDPSDRAAVVGGNVLTSQRLVDTVLKAFAVCAASQGCMNNVTIGDDTWGYYETVAGGAGAGPGWHGADGVHTHMTNTRITDPEILETRYPIVLRRFSLRDDESGGVGRWRGGAGVHREMLFRKPVHLSVLTERRVLQPYGMAGGGAAARGLNLLIRGGDGGRTVNLGAKCAVHIETGDIFSMRTPGGGGYGSPLSSSSSSDGDSGEAHERVEDDRRQFVERGSVAEYRRQQEQV